MKFISGFSILALLMSPPLMSQSPKALPFLRTQGEAMQLIVDHKPVLLLSGEWGNSSAADGVYMRPIWPKLKDLHLNSALVPVYWELVEPTEGHFDFTLVDSLVHSARRYDLKLVLLWFGSWKNSMSCYVPLWVKADQRRFPRSRTRSGEAVEILTPFSDANLQADARAFAALMRHINKIDARAQTVLMVQVENEIGMIPEARDHVPEAETAYAAPVPAELMSYLQKNKATLRPEFVQMWEKTGYKAKGNWEEVFGAGVHTEELFMAWHFARYTNAVTQAGKAEYALPMFVNAALIRPGYRPGQYPSAGPLPHLMDVWRAGAPQIDFLTPDIYFRNFAEWCQKYDHPGNAFFIPEVDSRQSPANAFYAMAQHDAMGYSPFAIESLENPGKRLLAQAYEVLHQMTPVILANQGSGNLVGVLLDSAAQQSRFELGDYIFTVKHEYSWPYAQKKEGEVPRHGGMFIKLAEDEFYMAGTGLVVTFAARQGAGARAGIGSVDEGKFVEGTWRPGRRLNGDQTHQGRHAHLPGHEFGILRVKLYTYR